MAASPVLPPSQEDIAVGATLWEWLHSWAIIVVALASGVIGGGAALFGATWRASFYWTSTRFSAEANAAELIRQGARIGDLEAAREAHAVRIAELAAIRDLVESQGRQIDQLRGAIDMGFASLNATLAKR